MDREGDRPSWGLRREGGSLLVTHCLPGSRYNWLKRDLSGLASSSHIPLRLFCPQHGLDVAGEARKERGAHMLTLM